MQARHPAGAEFGPRLSHSRTEAVIEAHCTARSSREDSRLRRCFRRAWRMHGAVRPLPREATTRCVRTERLGQEPPVLRIYASRRARPYLEFNFPSTWLYDATTPCAGLAPESEIKWRAARLVFVTSPSWESVGIAKTKPRTWIVASSTSILSCFDLLSSQDRTAPPLCRTPAAARQIEPDTNRGNCYPCLRS